MEGYCSDSHKTYLHGTTRGRRTLGRVATVGTSRSAVSATRTGVGRHASGSKIVRRGRGRAIRSAYTRVVLRTAPREADARITDRVTLHLINCHLRGVAMDELDKTAALSRRDLDVGDFTKALEERAKLVFSDVAGETTDEDGGVVRVGELIHGLHRIKRGSGLGVAVGRDTTPHRGLGAGDRGHHLVATLGMTVLVRAATSQLETGKTGEENMLHTESWGWQ